MKLEHLAPYLPYKLNVAQPMLGKTESYLMYGLKYSNYADEWIVYIDDSRLADYQSSYLKGIKPILRPLSEFKYQDIIKVKNYLGVGKWCDYYDLFFDAWFDDSERLQNLALQMPFELMQFFLKNHFDVFGLIEKGEAIDINTL